MLAEYQKQEKYKAAMLKEIFSHKIQGKKQVNRRAISVASKKQKHPEVIRKKSFYDTIDSDVFKQTQTLSINEQFNKGITLDQGFGFGSGNDTQRTLAVRPTTHGGHGTKNFNSCKYLIFILQVHYELYRWIESI